MTDEVITREREIAPTSTFPQDLPLRPTLTKLTPVVFRNEMLRKVMLCSHAPQREPIEAPCPVPKYESSTRV